MKTLPTDSERVASTHATRKRLTEGRNFWGGLGEPLVPCVPPSSKEGIGKAHVLTGGKGGEPHLSPEKEGKERTRVAPPISLSLH